MPQRLKDKKIPYKYGGHRVPGMFQEGGTPPMQKKPQFNPFTHFKTKAEYDAYVAAGSPPIDKYVAPPPTLINPTPPVPPRSMPTPVPQIPTGPTNPMQLLKKKKAWEKKRGGSVGSNGML